MIPQSQRAESALPFPDVECFVTLNCCCGQQEWKSAGLLAFLWPAHLFRSIRKGEAGAD